MEAQADHSSLFWDETRRILSLLIAAKIFNFDTKMLLSFGFKPKMSTPEYPRLHPNVSSSVKNHARQQNDHIEMVLDWAVKNEFFFKHSKTVTNCTTGETEIWECYRREANRHYKKKGIPIDKLDPFCKALDTAQALLMREIREKDFWEGGYYSKFLLWLSQQRCIVLRPGDGFVPDPLNNTDKDKTEDLFKFAIDACCVTMVLSLPKKGIEYYQVIPARCGEILRGLKDQHFLPHGDMLAETLWADIIYQGFNGVSETSLSGDRSLCKAKVYRELMQWLNTREKVTFKTSRSPGSSYTCFVGEFPIPEGVTRNMVLQEFVDMKIIRRVNPDSDDFLVNHEILENLFRVWKEPELMPEFLGQKDTPGIELESKKLPAAKESTLPPTTKMVEAKTDTAGKTVVVEEHMEKLTKKKSEQLELLRKNYPEGSVLPSNKDLIELFGITSEQGVYLILADLKKNGAIVFSGSSKKREIHYLTPTTTTGSTPPPPVPPKPAAPITPASTSEPAEPWFDDLDEYSTTVAMITGILMKIPEDLRGVACQTATILAAKYTKK